MPDCRDEQAIPTPAGGAAAITGTNQKESRVQKSSRRRSSTGSGRTPLFSDGAVPITAVDFTRQDALGHRVSAVVADGQLSYPDRPGAAPWGVQSSDLVALDRLQRFDIRRIAVDPGQRGMQFALEGIAGRVTTQRGYVSCDHRLTAFHTLSRKPGWLVLSLLAWVIPTGVGAYRVLERRSAFREAQA